MDLLKPDSHEGLLLAGNTSLPAMQIAANGQADVAVGMAATWLFRDFTIPADELSLAGAAAETASGWRQT